MTLIIGLVTMDVHGAISTALGGLVTVSATAVAAVVATLHRDNSAGSVLMAALRAEAVKITLIALLLALILTTYKSIVVLFFIGMFIFSILFSGIAIFFRDR